MIGAPGVETNGRQSWSGLAACYEALGDVGKALEIEIMAAHMTIYPDTWTNLAEKSKCATIT
jgi:general transcription factor 3C polypeptide 3 (transcription factor C subunit 4)